MPSLVFEIESKLKEAGFKDASDWLNKHAAGLQKNTEASGGLLEASKSLIPQLMMFAELAGTVEFFKECTNAAIKDQEAMLQLQGTYESTGKKWEKVAGQVEQFTAALSESTRFSKIDAVSALDLMIQKTHNLGLSENLLTDAMGLAIKRKMDLASAADLVAGAAENQGRAIMQLGRMMGLNVDQMHSSAEVLQVLHQRYGQVAESEASATSTQKKFGNAMEETMVHIGRSFLPAVGVVETALTYLVKFIGAVWDTIVSGGVNLEVALMAIFTGIGNVMYDVLTLKWKNVKGDAKAALDQVGQAFLDFQNDEAKAMEVFNDKVTKTVAPDPEKHKKMMDETKKAIAQFNLDVLKQSAQTLDQKAALLRKETDLQKIELEKQLLAVGESAANRHKVALAAEKDYNAKLSKLYVDDAKSKIEAVQKIGDEIGIATGQMLAGQQDAWKSGMKAVIDTVIQTTEKIVIANYIAGASQEVARGGWVGVATGAGLLALGFGVAQGVADTVLSGGGSSASPAGTSAGATAARAQSSPVVAPAASSGAAAPPVVVNVRVDNMYGSTQYASMMARLLSDAVMNKGVKLTASGLQ